MPPFLNHDFAELTRQLTYAPAERRREQMDRAEHLYWDIDPQRNYPLDYIIYRLTKYRPRSGEHPTLTGEAARKDLLLFVERISESLDDPAGAYDPPPHDLPGLAKFLGVSTRTVNRYRREGLFGRRLRFGRGRPRIAFPQPSVDRFLEGRAAHLRRAADFSRIDEETRHAIITRARRITARAPGVRLFPVARHLARKHRRSTEAVRLLLIEHDRRDPRVAIFRGRASRLTERQQRVIHRAHRRGVPVARLARRFHKGRNAIYHAINRQRAIELRKLDIRYIHNPTFDLPDAERVILGSEIPGTENPETDREPSPNAPRRSDTADAADPLGLYLRELDGRPNFNAAAERALFARYHFLKHRAAALRDRLDRRQPAAGQLDAIETHLRHAAAVKHRLVRGYQRLAVSVARKHLAAKRGRFDVQALADLVAEGNLVLLEAIETFDAGRGNRFSTYLTWALMRRFAQARTAAGPPREVLSLDAHPWLRDQLPAAINPNLAALEHAEHVAHTLRRLLGQLDQRERAIVTRHFGLGEGEAPRTLAEIAADLGISPERARRLERRALARLRRSAARP